MDREFGVIVLATLACLGFFTTIGLFIAGCGWVWGWFCDRNQRNRQAQWQVKELWEYKVELMKMYNRVDAIHKHLLCDRPEKCEVETNAK